MPFDRKSFAAWAAAAAESLLRDGGRSTVPDTARPMVGRAEPAGTPCRSPHPGHAAHYLPASLAGEVRRRGDAIAVRYADHAFIPAGQLEWAEDSVAGSDPERPVTMLELERDDATTLTVLTHDRRGLAAIEACGRERMWWVPTYSMLLVPSWNDDPWIEPRDRREATSWPTLSVASYDEPWRPCPIAGESRRTRPFARTGAR
jgi:hypothetical protein